MTNEGTLLQNILAVVMIITCLAIIVFLAFLLFGGLPIGGIPPFRNPPPPLDKNKTASPNQLLK